MGTNLFDTACMTDVCYKTCTIILSAFIKNPVAVETLRAFSLISFKISDLTGPLKRKEQLLSALI